MLGDHRFEHRVRISGYDYYDDAIASLKITGGLFSENRFSFGGRFARSIDIELYPSPYATPPRMASIRVYVRVVNDTKTSTWVTIGEFFIDTRETNDLGLMHITGYDAMLKAEKLYIDPGDVGQWPKKMIDVAEDIASKMGVILNTSSLRDYDVQLPTGYTMREVLSFIAAANAGNWIINPSGYLELIEAGITPASQSIGRNVKEFETGPVQSGWTRVIVNTGDDTYVEAGDETGETFEVFCPWGTTEMAQYILNRIANYKYRPYEARGAIIDPALEIGDSVNIDGTVYLLASIEMTHDALCAADISAPTDKEIDHEYPYISSLNRQIKRRLQTIETTLYVGPESIVASVKDIDGRITQVSQTADKINWLVASGTDATNFTMTDRAVELVSASINLTGYVTFNSLTEAGSTAINGANITTGKIAAERIDVSELHLMKLYNQNMRVAISCASGYLYIGGDVGPLSDYDKVIINTDEVIIGAWGQHDSLVFDVRTNEIHGQNSWTWKLGTSTYGFECLWLNNASQSVQLTAGVGKLLVNGSEVLTGSLEISAIKSGSYSLTISGNSITPSSTSITLGSSSYYFDQIFTEEMKLCYSSTRSLTLSCGYSGELLINGNEYVPSKLVYGTYELELSSDGLIPSSASIDLGTAYDHFGELYSEKLNVCRDKFNYATLTCDSSGYLNCSTSILPGSTTSYDLGSSSRLWNYLHTKTVRVYYNSYTYVDLACNYNGQLTAGGSVVATT